MKNLIILLAFIVSPASNADNVSTTLEYIKKQNSGASSILVVKATDIKSKGPYDMVAVSYEVTSHHKKWFFIDKGSVVKEMTFDEVDDFYSKKDPR